MAQSPDIQTSSHEERIAFVKKQWECMHHCESCGKCHILRGHSAVDLYADYIEGKRTYMDVTHDIIKR